MRTSRKLTHVLFAIFALLTLSVAALAADPGTPVGVSTGIGSDPNSSGALVEIGSDMKTGSILAYTHYRSDANNSSTEDTRVNITNVHPTQSVVVHFFFVNSSCSVADFKTELTQNQTYSFLTSDFDPGERGYILAVAEDEVGVPISWNFLIGDAFIKLTNTYSINLAAISYAARFGFTDGRVGQQATGTSQPMNTPYSGVDITVNFGGAVATAGSYDALARAYAIDNIPSRAGGDRTWVIHALIQGTYVTSPGGSSTLFGVLYDDAEQGQSFTWSLGCASVTEITNTSPRTAPRLDTVIPAGRTGWIRTYYTGDQGGAMSMLVANSAWATAPSTNFHGGHNVHVLTRASSRAATFPVFPYELQTN